MTLKPTTLRRLAIVLTVFNVGGAAFALASGESWHAGVHVSLAVIFGLAAQRLRESSEREAPSLQQQLDEQGTVIDEAHAKLESQASQLAELQERLDYAERMLAQSRDRAMLEQREKTKREEP